MPEFNLSKLAGHIPAAVISQIPDTAQKFNITTPLRLAHFLSQCAQESGNWTAVSENLNYSEQGLLGVFSQKFDVNHDRALSDQEKLRATQLARHPEQIANFVYSDRLGNGNESSGDGWKYRGRGYIQLTGKSNYSAFDKLVTEDILANPDLVATKYPLMSAAFFFNSNGLWAVCDRGADLATVTAVTKRVNGGTLGLDGRLSKFNEYYALLK